MFLYTKNWDDTKTYIEQIKYFGKFLYTKNWDDTKTSPSLRNRASIVPLYQKLRWYQNRGVGR